MTSSAAAERDPRALPGEGLQGTLLSLPAAGPREVREEGVGEPVARVILEGAPAHLDRTFDYLVPATFDHSAQPGTRVQVRFGPRDHSAVIVARGSTTDHRGDLAPLRRVVTQAPVVTPQVLELCTRVARQYAGTVGDVLRLAVPARHATTESAELDKDAPARVGARPWSAEPRALSQLTGGAALLRRIAAGEGPRAAWTTLPGTREDAVDDLTAAALASGRGILVIVPTAREVAVLAEALTRSFPDEPVARLVAEDGPSQRYRSFLQVLLGRARIAVGTRAAAFAPLHPLGVAVIWDDDDALLVEPRSPYPHAREILLHRSDSEGAALVLGSHARSIAVQDLIQRGVVHAVTASRELTRQVTPRVEAPDETALARDGAAGAARIPPAAFALVRQALTAGPVLVQVASGGFIPVIACARCRTPARCAYCAGPLHVPPPPGAAAGAAHPADTAAASATCQRCGRLAAGWRCPECGATHLRGRTVGSARTAAELGRAFTGIPVIASGTTTDYGIIDSVDARPRLVVATPGAEPVAEGGYTGALLLDAGLATARPELGATSRALRRWFHAAALVRPSSAGGRVMLLGHPARSAALSVVRWDPAGAAQRELRERLELQLPPATALAALEGAPEAVADFLLRVQHSAEDRHLPVPEVLGPVPIEELTSLAPRSRGTGARAEGPLVRAVLRGGRRGSPAAAHLADLVRATAAARALRRSGGPVRAQIDPEDLW